MSPAVPIVLIVFVSLLSALTLVCWTIVSLVQGGKQKHASNAEESQLIQELHQGMNKMEQRVESLETLILDRERDRADR